MKITYLHEYAYTVIYTMYLFGISATILQVALSRCKVEKISC